MESLKEKVTTTERLSWTVPNILVGVTTETGRDILNIREGGSVNVDATITHEWTEQEVSEDVFKIIGTIRMNLPGGTLFDALTDPVQTPQRTMPASSPSASEYLAQIGKPTLIFFACKPDASETKRCGRQVFKVSRVTIHLP